MRSLRLALALALALALVGCLDQFRGGEGEESLTIRNVDSRGVEVVARIASVDAQVEVFRETAFFAPGEAREYALALRPGRHLMAVTTSTHLDERLDMEVPTRGDTRWTLTLSGSAASLARS